MFDLYGTEMYCKVKMEERLKEAEEHRLLATLKKTQNVNSPSFTLSSLAGFNNLDIELKLGTGKLRVFIN